jgi:two-component system, OmpR family, sensor histidine kinase BaeS
VTGRRLLGPLALRLAAAFLAVAVAAIGVLAALTILAARTQVSDLVAHEQRADASSAAATLADAYLHAGGWRAANLAPAAAVAAQAQATLVVTNPVGVVIAAPNDALGQMMAAMHGVASVTEPRGAPVDSPVVVAGRTVGVAHLRFPTSGLPAPERAVRDALWRTAVTGTAIAVAVALLVAVLVAYRVTRPLVALTDAAERLAGGDRGARAGHRQAPGELGVLASSFDRMAGALQTEDRLRRILVADVAHELRTPLTILRGQTEAMIDGVIEPTGPALASLHDEVLRLGRVVGDLETLAAAEAAGLALQFSPVDLASIATNAVDLLQPAAADAGLELLVDAQPANAEGDPGRLQQIAVNLLANAVKFSTPGGRITVRTWAEHSRVNLEVADTGPGIPDDELGHVFERFWRGRQAQATEGSGIGLAVASELAAAHRGTLIAANTPKGGARFVLNLPGRAAVDRAVIAQGR